MNGIFQVSGIFAYIIMVFLNAFVDLGHKIIIQNTLFKTLDGPEQVIMSAVLNALILLPIALLFSPAGFISDRFAKPKVMKASAFVAVILSLCITLCYYLGLFEIAFAMTLLLATQSAIYSPAKYGYLREYVGKQRLSQANALLQGTTVVSILMGTFAFSILFESLLKDANLDPAVVVDGSQILRIVAPAGWLLVISSIWEFVLTYRLPKRPAAAPDLKFEAHRYLRGEYLKTNLMGVYRNKGIWICIIGLAIFWAISQVMITVFPAHAKASLGITNTVVIQGLLACTGIGIVIGSAIAGKFSRDYIETGFIAVGAVGIAFWLFAIVIIDNVPLMVLGFIGIGISSGFFIVPLNALIQFHAEQSQMARVVAASNLVQTLIMLSFLGLVLVCSLNNISAYEILFFLGVVASLGAVYTVLRIPHSLIRFIVAHLVGFRYRIRVLGLENLPSQGGVLLLGNHVSFLDWAILGIASPRKVRFVMRKNFYEKWHMSKFFKLAGAIPISPKRSDRALTAITKALNAGDVVCLFPEGALTRDGQMGEFKRGFEIAARKADATIVPFYIAGLWGSRFSLAKRVSEDVPLAKTTSGRTQVVIALGETLTIDSQADAVREAVAGLAEQAQSEIDTTLAQSLD